MVHGNVTYYYSSWYLHEIVPLVPRHLHSGAIASVSVQQEDGLCPSDWKNVAISQKKKIFKWNGWFHYSYTRKQMSFFFLLISKNP